MGADPLPQVQTERETSLTAGNNSTEEFVFSCWDSETVLSSELNVHRLPDPLFKARSAPACYFTRQGACLEFPLSWKDCKQTLGQARRSSRPSNKAFIQTDISAILQAEPTLPRPNALHAANFQAVKLHYLLQPHTSPKTTYCV